MGTEPMDLDPVALEKATEAYWDAQGGTTGGICAAIRAYLAAAPATPRTLPPEPPPGFVRVRIAAAVGVEDDGRIGWGADGQSGATDADLAGGVSHWNGPFRLSYVTADVPLPDAPPEIVGTMERDAPATAEGGQNG